MKNDFHLYVRDEFGPTMKTRGYRRSGGSFAQRASGVGIAATFMRYQGALAGKFNVRMQVTLPDHYEALGVIIARDLSNLLHRAAHLPRWQWPLVGATRANVTQEVLQGLEAHALPWLESFLDPHQLALHLESEKRITAASDEAFLGPQASLAGVGAQPLHQSPGFMAPRAGKLIPSNVRALSYCYQLTEQWQLALSAWDEYGSTFERLPTLGHPVEVQLRERRAFLEERASPSESRHH